MAVKAYILIETKVGKTKEVSDRLKGINKITAVDVVAGPYDVIAVIEAEDLNSVGDLVTMQIHAVGGITRTVTCMVVGA